MARKRKSTPYTQRAPVARRVQYHDDRASQDDVYSAHMQIRDINHRLDITLGLVDSHEARIMGIETRQREERDMIAEVRADLLLLKRENARTLEVVEGTKALLEKVMENINCLSAALSKHIRTEASDYSVQTKRIELLARRMLLAWVSFTGLAIICYAVYSQITGSFIGDLIPHILGFGV